MSDGRQTRAMRGTARSVLRIIGKELTETDLIDAHFRDADARVAQIESEPLPATTYDVLAEAAAETPERTAWNFFETGESFTYREALETVNRLAGSLAAIGVDKGVHVAVMLLNRPAFPLTWLALGRLGAVMIPINIGYTGRELDFVINDSDARYLVIDSSLLDAFNAMEERPAHLTADRIIIHDGPDAAGSHDLQTLIDSGDPGFAPVETAQADDLMNIQYTSGTTGFPKGCMLAQARR